MLLADKREGVADSNRLLQSARPAESILLHLGKAAIHNWQYALQVRLHTDKLVFVPCYCNFVMMPDGVDLVLLCLLSCKLRYVPASSCAMQYACSSERSHIQALAYQVRLSLGCI